MSGQQPATGDRAAQCSSNNDGGGIVTTTICRSWCVTVGKEHPLPPAAAEVDIPVTAGARGRLWSPGLAGLGYGA